VVPELRAMKGLLYLGLPLYALDQVTKWLVDTRLEWQQVVPIVPGFFDLVHVTNTGAAFGALKGGHVFFVILSLGVLAAAGWALARKRVADGWTRLGTVLLMAGVAGNLTDRLLRGHVVDFLQFDLGFPPAHPWPAFNVADSCICVAAALFVFRSFVEGRKPGSGN
jgi:signal peptidase II